ncbi:Hypothetical predicted protein [Olea europaea subsp. europaea]|uniref:Uncharacterized protein n=1 Tax=Olea europaea subsp. europaea TaxID=158383 RepID=A0A8S0RNB2_OLEEU|nr:Hypothetical predicted protein [Olea europaea subsp. europaea]
MDNTRRYHVSKLTSNKIAPKNLNVAHLSHQSMNFEKYIDNGGSQPIGPWQRFLCFNRMELEVKAIVLHVPLENGDEKTFVGKSEVGGERQEERDTEILNR